MNSFDPVSPAEILMDIFPYYVFFLFSPQKHDLPKWQVAVTRKECIHGIDHFA